MRDRAASDSAAIGSQSRSQTEDCCCYVTVQFGPTVSSIEQLMLCIADIK